MELTRVVVSAHQAQAELNRLLLHPLPDIRRVLLNYLLRVKNLAPGEGVQAFTFTVQSKENGLREVCVTGERLLQLMEETLAEKKLCVDNTHLSPVVVAQLQNKSLSLWAFSLRFGISFSTARKLRRQGLPSRIAVAPVGQIFREILKGKSNLETARKYGVSDQTVSNARSKILDLVLYKCLSLNDVEAN